jgi:hypothetical protein
MDKEYEQFLLDLLFISVFCDDHEDAMNDVLAVITDEDEYDEEEFNLEDIAFAAMFAGVYHTPTSFEQEALNDVQKILALRHLNG